MIKNILKVPMHVGIFFVYLKAMEKSKIQYCISENLINDFNGTIFDWEDYNFLREFDFFDLTRGSRHTVFDFADLDWEYSELVDENISHVHVTPI